LMPTVDHVGVSRRIADEEERQRLKSILERLKPKGMGMIVRTVAQGMEEADFTDEIQFLKRLWDRINKRSRILSAPRLIHSEESLVFRTVRDMLASDITRFRINNREYYEKVLAVAKIVAPQMSACVEYYDQPFIFEDYNVEKRIDKLLSKKVWLKSGGYLIIDETEALTVIDVNTGKYVGVNDLQETILNTNIEAAKEIARQLRLRDISGIIIIDFIDMEIVKNKEKVVEALEKALQNDRTKSNVLGITELGLVEMTRKKSRRKLSSLLKMSCPYCNGSGKVDSEETVAMRLSREIKHRLKETDYNDFLVEVHPSVADYIHKKSDTKFSVLPKQPGKKFYVLAQENIHIEQINIKPVTNKKDIEHVLRQAKVFC